MENIEKFRTPKSMHRRELSEGLADAEVEKELLKVANGVRRRIANIESNPESDEDIATHLKFEHIVDVEEIESQDQLWHEARNYEKGGWEIHFRKHLDSLSFPDLLAETKKYLQIISSDSSAVQEYRLCLELLDRIAASGMENVSITIRDGNIEVNLENKDFSFPLNVKLESGREIHCRAASLECKHLLEKNQCHVDDLEACNRILETKSINDGFEILLERMGYGHEMTVEDREVFNSIIDTALIAQSTQDVDVNEFTQYGFVDGFFMNEFAPDRNSGETLVTTILKEWANITEAERVKLSQTLGRMLGKMAARTSSLQIVESALVIASGLLENEKIRQAFKAKTKEAAEKKWFDTEIDPLQDMKIKALYKFTRNAVDNGADLETRMKWADYIDSTNFQLDMTRGNDPTILDQGMLSGVPEHQGKSAGYEPGIYCGVAGAFYNWSNTHKAIIKNMPLKNVDDIRGRGEAVVMCKGLKPRKN